MRAGAVDVDAGGTGNPSFNTPKIAFETSGNSYINTGGNFGIGVDASGIPAESKLVLGSISASEGGQLQLNSGTGFTTAHFIDVYGDAMRFLRGTNSGTASVSMGIEGNGNVNIGTAIAPERFTVGNSNQFRVSSTGDLVRIKDVPYVWPSANAAGSLVNDGSGNLSWGSGSSLFTAGTGLSWSGTILNSVWTVNGTHIHNNNSGNVGIGAITSPATLLHIGSTADATTDSKVMRVQTNGFAGIELFGDNSNAGGEPGGAYIRVSQDANAVAGIFGVVQNTNGNGAGGTLTGSVGNSVILTNTWNDATGHLHFGTQNTVRMTVAGTGNVGIGTTGPDRPLTVANNSEWNIASRSTNTTATNRNHILLQRANGSSAVIANFMLGGIAIGGYDGSNYGFGWNGGAEITAFANQTWTAANRGTYLTFGTTADNTASIAERMRIAANGTVSINTTSAPGTFNVNGNAVIGTGLTSRAALGITTSANNATTYVANADVGDGARMFSIVNENATANSMAILSMRSNPGGGANNQMFDMKLHNPNDGTSRLIYSFGPNASFTDRFTFTSGGRLGIGSTNPAVKLDVIHPGNETYGVALRLNQNAIANSDGPKIEFYKTMASSKNWTAGILNGVDVGTFGISEDAGSGGFGTPRFVVLPGGNVGIGTNTPISKLDVQGGHLTVGTLYGTNVMYGTLGSFDTRSTNPNPETYNMGVVSEFKANASNGLSDGGTYNSVLSIRQWSSGGDWSGGGTHQLGLTQNGNLWHRYSQTTGSWGAWKRVLYTTDIPGGVLPTGTSGQTLRHNGTSWIANSLLYNNGTNVGVGTTSPGALLDIGGNPNNAIRTAYLNISANNASITDRAYIRGTADHIVIVPGGTSNTGTKTVYMTYPEGSGSFQTRIQETQFFSTTGSGGGANIAIGNPSNASPSSKLHVMGSTSGLTDYGILTLGEANGNNSTQRGISFGYDATNEWAWMYARTVGCCGRTININNTAYIQPGGNLGIGISAPLAKLDVEGGAFLGYETNISNFGIPLKSGFYQDAGVLVTGDIPDQSHGWTHLITARHSNTGNNHQLQIASSYSVNDRLFFRKIAATGTDNPSWNEVVATTSNGNNSSNVAWVLSANFSHSVDDWCTGCSGTGNIADLADDATNVVTMPFSIRINGTSYNQVSICTNGWIAFGSTTAPDYSNTALPAGFTSLPVIFPYWDDLRDYGGGEWVRWGTVGTSPNRTFIIDYNMRVYGGGGDRVNFMVLIHETSAMINVKYRDTMSPGMNGQSATIGFQLNGGSSAKAYPIVFNGKVLDDNRDDAEGWSVCPVR